MTTLHDLGIHARSGDKGDWADIGVFAPNQLLFDTLVRELTVERVKALYAPLGITAVRCHPLPHLLALKLVLEGALGGGAARSLRSDNLGKTLATALLRLEIDPGETSEEASEW